MLVIWPGANPITDLSDSPVLERPAEVFASLAPTALISQSISPSLKPGNCPAIAGKQPAFPFRALCQINIFPRSVHCTDDLSVDGQN